MINVSRKLFYVIIFCSFIFCNNLLKGQNNEPKQIYKSNVEIFELLVKKNFMKIEDMIIVSGKENIYSFSVNANDEGHLFFTDNIRKYLNEYKIITEDTIKSEIRINISDIKTIVNYKIDRQSIFSGKTVKREIKYSYNIKESKTGLNENHIETYSDIIPYDEIEYVNSSIYKFTAGEYPEESFFQKIIIPATVVAFSALAIALFFIIRSN